MKWEELTRKVGGAYYKSGRGLLKSDRSLFRSGEDLINPIPSRPHKYIWHGSDMQGERALSSFCDAWHSDSRDVVGLASSLLKNNLLAQEKRGCHNSYAVLCIEATSHAYDKGSGRRRRHAGFGIDVASDSSSDSDSSGSSFASGFSSESERYDLTEDEYYDMLDGLDSEV